MDEYIKREDALDAVLFALVGTGHQSKAICAIRDVHTADVVPKSEVVNMFAERVKPLFERIVELMFDGNEPTCQVENCHKPDSIGCGSRICIDENIAWWKTKVDIIAKELTEDKT